MTAPTEESVDPGAVSAGIAFHDTLNPAIWDGDEMRLEVRVHLLRAAKEFYEFLDVEGLRLSDIIFTGSNCAYNYTSLSDCDVHLLVDFENSVCPDLAENFFNTKKSLWNASHDIEIRGYGVEMYVEDTGEPVKAQGVYSLVTGNWVRKPSREKPEWNDSDVFAKVDQLADEIDRLLDSTPDYQDIQDMFARLRKLRKAGLEKGGEFSVENLAFKALRNLGFLERLSDARTQSQDSSLSLN